MLESLMIYQIVAISTLIFFILFGISIIYEKNRIENNLGSKIQSQDNMIRDINIRMGRLEWGRMNPPKLKVGQTIETENKHNKKCPFVRTIKYMEVTGGEYSRFEWRYYDHLHNTYSPSYFYDYEVKKRSTRVKKAIPVKKKVIKK